MDIRLKIRKNATIIESMLPIISASTIGSIIQWFDFYLYSFLALTVFPALFFPKLNPVTGVLASFFQVIFVGFAARPLGAACFGWLGDRIGRRSTLFATLLLIGCATILVGILPGYSTIGITAPILLTLLRFLQGIGVGGEWGGATLLVLENCDDRHRGFWTSLPQASVPIGLALALGAILLFKILYPGSAFDTIGWRMPFLLNPLLLLVAFYIRLRIPETPPFAHMQTTKQESKAPLLDVFRYHWREVFLSALLPMGHHASFYLSIFFVFTYGEKTLRLGSDLLYKGIIIATLLEVLVIPVIGMISDHIGRKRCYLIGCVAIVCLAFPYFWLLNTRNAALVVLAIILSLIICHACVYAPLAAMITERFSTKVRYTGASLSYQWSSLAAGGPAPIIGTYLLTNQARLVPSIPAYVLIAAYIIIMSVISFLAVLPLKEYTGKPLPRI